MKAGHRSRRRQTLAIPRLHAASTSVPLLQTLEIHEVITARDADIQRAGFKRAVRAMAHSARNLATGLRRRMNEVAIKEPERAHVKTAKNDVKLETAADEVSAAAGEAGEGKVQVHVVPHNDTAHAEQT